MRKEDISYLTILETGYEEQVIDKSRFIAVAFPVKTVDAVESSIEQARRRYPNARHYVYAYRLFEGRLEKSTDDGEPQGTGGRPVLDVMQFRGLWDVLVVVIRYFGGILLGTGGLTRAYGGTARQLLDRLEVSRLVSHVVYEVETPYSWYEPLKYQYRQHKWATGNEEFAETVKVEVFVRSEETQMFEDWLTEVTEKEITACRKECVLRAERVESRP